MQIINKKIKDFMDKYESYLSPVILFGGFLFDNFTLRRIDLWMENLVILIYLGLALFFIAYLNVCERGFWQRIFSKKGANWASFALQFVFGGLFSVFFVFYSRSASLFDSWIFLLILLILLVGNERAREKYFRFIVHVNIFYFTLFSYFVFAVPIFLGRMGADVFLISGALSLVCIGIILYSLYKITAVKYKQSIKKVIAGIVGVYLFFNLMYFANVIPPIPLALKEIDIYHSISRVNGDYSLSYEKLPWYVFWDNNKNIYHKAPGEGVYVYSAIFAPTKISTKIFHQWYFFEDSQGIWIKRDKLGYNIVGGRENGYRGYSVKYNLEAGRWRVDVITGRGQVLGRKKFEVVLVGKKVELSKIKK